MTYKDKYELSELYFIGQMAGIVSASRDALKRIEYISEKDHIELSPKAKELYERLSMITGDLAQLSIELGQMANKVLEK